MVLSSWCIFTFTCTFSGGNTETDSTYGRRSRQENRNFLDKLTATMAVNTSALMVRNSHGRQAMWGFRLMLKYSSCYAVKITNIFAILRVVMTMNGRSSKDRGQLAIRADLAFGYLFSTRQKMIKWHEYALR